MAAAKAAPEKPRQGLRLGAIAGPVCLAVVLAIALGTVKRSPWPPALVDKACPVDEADQSGPVNTTPYGPELHEALLQTLPGGLVQSTGLDISQPGVAVSSCRLQGSLDGCCNCTYQEVDEVNDRIVYPTLKQLVATPFFRYFKVNLWCDCPLWPDDSMCMLRACSVCPCENDELPQTWLRDEARNPSCSKSAGDPDSSHAATGSTSGGCNTAQCTAEADGVVDRELEPVVLARLQHLHGWRGLNNPWMAEGEEDEEFLYINLLANPERYTGYKGEHAHRIWSAIYNQSCFTQLQDCHEKRLFYRLISGMHASISAHIAANYLLDEEQGVWGPSIKEFKERLGTPAVRQRVKNLYFAYLFVLRAVSKAGPLLRQYTYDTGMAEEDARTAQLIKDLLSSAELPAACFLPFEPGRLWQGEMGEQLMETMQVAFRNITRVMDCVGCEKCKLWGKLQTLGVATALKILFSSPDCASAVPTLSGVPTPFRLPLSLERNEVIALLNLLERFAASLHHIHQLSELLALSEPADIIQRAADTIQ